MRDLIFGIIVILITATTLYWIVDILKQINKIKDEEN
jgi:heme/copper-type cytochrome/quinol oxidase subunit 4